MVNERLSFEENCPQKSGMWPCPQRAVDLAQHDASECTPLNQPPRQPLKNEIALLLSGRCLQRRKSAIEICLEVFDILQADVEPERQNRPGDLFGGACMLMSTP